MIKTVFVLQLLLLLATVVVKPCDDKGMERQYRDADFVIVAKVLNVQPIASPVEFWSGPVAVSQQVRYEVSKVYKGTYADQEMFISHYVVKGSKTADTKLPQLSQKLFAKGANLLLFIKFERPPEGPRYLVTDENCGAIRADSKTIAEFEDLIGSDQTTNM